MTPPQKPYPRAERVRIEIQHVLAEEVARMRDDLGFVTITDVTITRDLRNAKAYYTILEEKRHDAIRKRVEASTKQMRSAIAKQMRLKFVPTLELIEDPLPEEASKVDTLLRRLHQEGQD